MDSITKQLETSFGKPRILKNELLSKHTYMKVGGPADLFFIARSIKELETAITIARKNNLEYFIIGGGSNILVGDKGFRGLIVKNRAAAISFVKKGTVQKGMVLPKKGMLVAE